MNEKPLNARFVSKHDIEAHWSLAINFIPKQGEIIVYDIDENYNYERFKIGDGVTLVSDLPFSDSHLVQTINGIAPDKNGNVEIKVAASWNDLSDKPVLAAVSTSGSYNDLTDKPSLAAVAASGNYEDLVNVPEFSAVATSGSWNDLTDKPFGEKITRASFVDNITVSFTNGQSSAWDYTIKKAVDAKGGFTIGKTYYVMIDGAEYECVCVNSKINEYQSEKELHAVGDHGVKILYSIMLGIYQANAPVADGSHSFSIYSDDTTIIRLDEKYIPDAIARIDNLAPVAISNSYNDLIDKPIYYSEAILMQERKLNFTTKGFYLGFSFLMGRCNTLYFDGEQYQVPNVFKPYDGLEIWGNPGLYSSDYEDNGMPIAIAFEKGMYYAFVGENNLGEHTLSATDLQIVKLDPRFLPDGILTENDLINYAKTSEVKALIAEAIGSAIGGSY